MVIAIYFLPTGRQKENGHHTSLYKTNFWLILQNQPWEAKLSNMNILVIWTISTLWLTNFLQFYDIIWYTFMSTHYLFRFVLLPCFPFRLLIWTLNNEMEPLKMSCVVWGQGGLRFQYSQQILREVASSGPAPPLRTRLASTEILRL